jgi:diapolycopene oxygenase
MIRFQAVLMTTKYSAIVIGAGIGGLTAAIYLARNGFSVQLLEARSTTGGLASGFTLDDLSFDYGPYILQDRPGLEWVFQQLGEDLARRFELRKIEDIYTVNFPNGARVSFYADLERTASEFEKQWPGAARKYISFVRHMEEVHHRLWQLAHTANPRPTDLLPAGRWRNARFLLHSLERVLTQTGLPAEIVNAIGIWPHLAGQRLDEAPSPMAFVPALFHTVGSYYPVGGTRRVAEVLTQIALDAGVQLQLNCKVKKIRTQRNNVTAVETEAGSDVPAGIVVANHGSIGVYVDLLDQRVKQQEELEKLPLQSPGVCAYLAVKRKPDPPYLRFNMVSGGEACRLFVSPGVPAPEIQRDGWYPARLLSSMHYDEAEKGTPAQQQYLEKMLSESWWQPAAGEYRVLTTQIPEQWHSRFNLYRSSMNPAMTGKFMRAGRMPHRSPHFGGLYFAGSSTHPGLGVSFSAISGILAGQCVLEDLGAQAR